MINSNMPTTSTECLNGMGACLNCDSKRSKVYNEIIEYGTPISPKTISSNTRINHNTVRGICSNLFKQGVIKQDLRGWYYVEKPLHEVQKEDFRFENILFVYSSPLELQSDKDVFENAVIKLDITYGREHNQISCRITHKDDISLTFKELLLVIDIFKMKVTNKLKIIMTDDKIMVRNLEFNNDLISTRLEGVECFTVTHLYESIEKFYNKSNPTRLRIEKRSFREFSVSDLINSMLYGNMYVDIHKKYEELNKKIDFMQNNQRGINNLSKITLDKLTYLIQEIKRLNEILSKFDSGNDLLNKKVRSQEATPINPF